MSYLFADPNSLSVEVAVASGAPVSMACWFKSTSITANQVLMAIVDKDVDLEYFRLAADGNVAGDPVRASASNAPATTGIAATTAGYTADVWQHAGAVFASTSSRSAYLNGGSKGTDTTSVTPVNLDRTSIGRFMRLTQGGTTLGRIAYPSVWTTALTDGEMATLAAGALPTSVQPGSQVDYWDLLANANDSVGANHLTVNGATLDGDNPDVGVVPMRSRRIVLPGAVTRSAVR